MQEEPRPFRTHPPRYSSAPLPASRYVPGSGAAHPGQRTEAAGPGTPASEPLLPCERWGEQASYIHGVDLFNHAFWWEAHEAWESLWARAEGTQRLFLQGLIQLAAALLKHHVRSAAGSVSLAREARGKLVAVCQRERLARGERFMGVDVPALLQAIDAAFAPVFQAERHGVVPPLAAPLVLELGGS
ncbi:MAG TPA: DUF309 domain-containing protein [Myxococcota bacterium]|nr:DUF309 domain-containing protein [Myxococcota bacterium]